MELKNALAVCLISLFSATLVVLIARSLDSQAASRLEPQLARIVEELEAIRKQGGVAAGSNQDSMSPVADDALIVYYLHGERCPTCLAGEANAVATLQTEYAAQLQSGEIVWRVLDYRHDSTAKALAYTFNVFGTAIVLAKMKDGQIDRSEYLDRTLALAEDKPALAAYLQGEIDAMLETDEEEPETASSDDAADIPLPDDSTTIPLPE